MGCSAKITRTIWDYSYSKPKWGPISLSPRKVFKFAAEWFLGNFWNKGVLFGNHLFLYIKAE